MDEGKSISKLKYLESDLKDKLFKKTVICKEDEFFALVGGESFQLNRDFPAETYIPDQIKKSQKLCVAIR